jgi:hypothetical protein
VSKIIQPNKPQSKIRVAIAIPAGDEVKTGFAYDLARLTAYTAATRHDIEIRMFVMRTSILPQARTELVRQALAADMTHILFLDSDMRFPREALIGLLEHEEPVVAANYVKRRMPIEPVTIMQGEKGPEYMHTTEESSGTQEALFIGLGVALIDLDVFRMLPEPWFQFWYKEGQFGGEDAFFSYHVRLQGELTLLVDHDLSKRVHHIGEFEFRNEHAVVSKEE